VHNGRIETATRSRRRITMATFIITQFTFLVGIWLPFLVAISIWLPSVEGTACGVWIGSSNKCTAGGATDTDLDNSGIYNGGRRRSRRRSTQPTHRRRCADTDEKINQGPFALSAAQVQRSNTICIGPGAVYSSVDFFPSFPLADYTPVSRKLSASHRLLHGIGWSFIMLPYYPLH